jgi:hypothetical protein
MVKVVPEKRNAVLVITVLLSVAIYCCQSRTVSVSRDGFIDDNRVVAPGHGIDAAGILQGIVYYIDNKPFSNLMLEDIVLSIISIICHIISQ